MLMVTIQSLIIFPVSRPKYCDRPINKFLLNIVDICQVDNYYYKCWTVSYPAKATSIQTSIRGIRATVVNIVAIDPTSGPWFKTKFISFAQFPPPSPPPPV